MSDGLVMIALSTKGKTMMQIDFGDQDPIAFWEDEPLTPEQEAAEYRAFIQMQETEAYAEFLDAPNCFD